MAGQWQARPGYWWGLHERKSLHPKKVVGERLSCWFQTAITASTGLATWFCDQEILPHSITFPRRLQRDPCGASVSLGLCDPGLLCFVLVWCVKETNWYPRNRRLCQEKTLKRMTWTWRTTVPKLVVSSLIWWLHVWHAKTKRKVAHSRASKTASAGEPLSLQLLQNGLAEAIRPFLFFHCLHLLRCSRHVVSLHSILVCKKKLCLLC